MYIGLHVKYPLFVSDFERNLDFLENFRKNTQIQIFMKIRRVGAELFEPGGRTDRHDEANSRFSKSCGPDALNP